MTLKLIGLVIQSANVSTEFLPPITPTLAYMVYSSQLIDNSRDMLRKPELTGDSI